MPNYSKSIIYKLCCKDTNVKDIYVGSTCNFTARKSKHKQNTKNRTDVKVYKFIKENGEWSNWDMIMIEEFSCDNKRQLEKKEREWIENLKPTLNILIPTRTKEEYVELLRQKYTCECGSIISKWSKPSHELSFKHLKFKSAN